jgi:phosphohistidine phosphatase
MKLYLVQHGEAVSETADPAKPLSPAGREDVRKLARGCAKRGLAVTEILHSGKLRAEQTAQILGEALGAPVRAISGIDPMDPVRPFAASVQGWNRDTAVAGHLPFLERLATLLAAGREEPSVVAFQRGGMACLEKRGSAWCILWTAFPDQPVPEDPGSRKEP